MVCGAFDWRIVDQRRQATRLRPTAQVSLRNLHFATRTKTFVMLTSFDPGT
jgi:hypothetical protein